MKQISLRKLRVRPAPGKRNRFLAVGCTAMVVLAFVLTGASAVRAAEEIATEATAGSGGGDILICVRQQGPLDGYGDGYGPERCVALAPLASGFGATGFGPASFWLGNNRRPVQAAAVQRQRNSYARQEFAALDLEKAARDRAPIAIWLLSYNIKDLASILPESPEYWTALELQRYQSIGLTALDPGIERNPTGLKAIGLRISVPY